MIKINKETISPKLAKQILENDANARKLNGIVDNRLIRDNYVIQYGKQMKAGRWKEDTVEPVKITSTGVLLDGQHRIKAIISANVSVNLWVARNVPAEVFDVLDTGCTRNAGDIFHIAGIKNANSIPAIMQAYYTLQKGNSVREGAGTKKTNSELYETVKQDEDYWQDVFKRASSWYSAFASVIHKSTIGGFYCYFSDLSQTDAEDFMNQLCRGIDIKHTAIHQLRNILIKDKMAMRKMTASFRAALIIKAWNCFRTNSIIKLLKYNPENDTYPKAV